MLLASSNRMPKMLRQNPVNTTVEVPKSVSAG
jgi:hypothetical protein